MKTYTAILVALTFGVALLGCSKDAADPGVAESEADGGTVVLDGEEDEGLDIGDPGDEGEGEEQPDEPVASGDDEPQDDDEGDEPTPEPSAVSASDLKPFVGTWVVDKDQLKKDLAALLKEQGAPQEQIDQIIAQTDKGDARVVIKANGTYATTFTDLAGAAQEFKGKVGGVVDATITLLPPTDLPEGAGVPQAMTFTLNDAKNRLVMPNAPGFPPMTLKKA